MQRKETEKWLREGFIQNGGVLKNHVPLYFILGESEYLRGCYGDVKVIKISLDEISQEDISFTLSDSMAIQVSEREKLVLSKAMLEAHISKKECKATDFIKKLDRNHQYIEAQLWNHDYFTI